jgi:hypothetical protein
MTSIQERNIPGILKFEKGRGSSTRSDTMLRSQERNRDPMEPPINPKST